MKILLFLILIVILNSRATSEKINQQQNLNSFLIKNIECKNNWFIISAYRNDSTFMIVSKKVVILNPNWEKLKIGNYYSLKLSSIIPVINGVKMNPINYLDFAEIKLDEEIFVNINPKKGVFDIYSSENLKGLYLIK